ncbi:unnamed protein product [Oppiella nova]|uniref:SLC41A/MgtE integral membrane domain-containing protein n=1 Tax=Oppiella nova TaxID=334625 RepID=A0A7R9M4S9_9ACAR|nr:unnamed protein product [Oppiella nova]CAG2170737.1 unnamed protein product [Oppiella nova]
MNSDARATSPGRPDEHRVVNIADIPDMTINNIADKNLMSNPIPKDVDKHLNTSLNNESINDSKEYSVNNSREYSATNNNVHKVCYDNPAFIGLSINGLTQSTGSQSPTPSQPTNISIIISNTVLSSSDESAGSHPPANKDRTHSLSSVHSIRNVLTPDRRYSRRQSIIQRKIDSSRDRSGSGGPGGVSEGPDGDDNPLRRKMSFIKDTSGEEPLNRAVIQILIASLFAVVITRLLIFCLGERHAIGFGNVGAGVIINIIQTWRVFIDIKTMFVLIPSLLGLKGNLEMTMASRLSTEANMGHMTKWKKTLGMIGGDMALVQCQATVVSFLAAFVAIGIDLARTQHFNLDHCLVLISSSVVTANVACFLLDNVATPIAASLGDVSTAALFAYFSEQIYADIADSEREGSRTPILAIAGIAVFLVLLPVFYVIARRNSFTHNLVHTGWTPVITAMLISSGGGFFLDSAVDRYDKLPPFQPVICGVGGNLVAVAASKLSTRLHMNWKLGLLPFGVSRYSAPWAVFWNKLDINTRLCLMLLLMAIPLHLLYSFVIWGIQRDRITLTAPLIFFYISFATLQVFILLFIGYNLVHILWSYSINPDMSAIPILTALGDLLGSAFLLIAFGILQSLSDPNAMLPVLTDNDTNTTIAMNTTIYLSLNSTQL